MTDDATARFRHAPRLLHRTSREHVLIRRADDHACDTIELGGAAAIVWSALRTPSSPEECRSTLTAAGAAGDLAEILSVFRELAAEDLIVRCP